MEIDVWDGEPHSPDSSDAEGTSDSDVEDTSLGDKLKKKIKSKTEKLSAELHDSRSVPSKLGGVLRQRSTKSGSTKGTSPSSGEDGSPVKGEPRVLHGHTLTKGTTFREICYAIRDSAFVASDLPVVVSLEVHASLEQQQTMVDIMQDAWKGLLVEVPPTTDPEKLPTLAELKQKIMIKAKSIPLEDTTEEVSPDPTNELDSKIIEEQPQKPAKPSKVLDALAKLAVYTRAYHFTRFDQPGTTVLS